MNKRKIIKALLTVEVLLIALCMAGCTKLSEAENDTATESDVSEESEKYGVYVRLERDDVSSIYLHGGSFTKVCQNADGTALEAGKWIFMGDDIAQLSQKGNNSVLFTVGGQIMDDTLQEEASFLYDAVQEKLYVTISESGVTCSTSDAPGATADVPPVRAAAGLLDWGVNTGLGTDEINDAASTWLAARNDNLTDCLHKLELVDDAYQRLLTDDARELLDSAGCAEVEITWGSEPVEQVEAIMQAAGLR